MSIVGLHLYPISDMRKYSYVDMNVCEPEDDFNTILIKVY
jgi:hypothetical protein